MTPRRDSYYPSPESQYQKIWKSIRGVFHKIAKPAIRIATPVLLFFVKWDKIALATAIGTLIAGLSFYTYIIGQRADLEFDLIRFIPSQIPVANTPVELEYLTHNAGKSTARIVDGDMHIIIGHSGRKLPEKPNFSRSKNFGSSYTAVVPPDKPQRGTWVPRDAAGRQALFTDAAVVALDSGDIQFSFYGTLTYTDDYSFLLGNRTLGFCAAYSGSPRREFHWCGPEYRAYTYSR